MLENSKIRLRPLEPSDLEFLYLWENDTSLWQYGDTRAPLSKELLENYIQNYDANILTAKQIRLMIVEKMSDTIIGTVDLYDVDIYNSRASIGLLIIPEFQGKGFGKETITLLEDYVLNSIGLSQLVNYIPETNINCLSLFKKLGYEQTGCLLHWHRIGREFQNVIVMQHIL